MARLTRSRRIIIVIAVISFIVGSVLYKRVPRKIGPARASAKTSAQVEPAAHDSQFAAAGPEFGKDKLRYTYRAQPAASSCKLALTIRPALPTARQSTGCLS